MFFWRAKKDRSEGVETSDEDEKSGLSAREAQADPAENRDVQTLSSNVVTLTPSRLSDRLAQAVPKSIEIIEHEAAYEAPAALVKAASAYALPGQNKAISALRTAIARNRPGRHIAVMGPPGSGRRTAIAKLIDDAKLATRRPFDWIYVTGGTGAAFTALPLPLGEGQTFAREVNAALANARAALDRLVLSDDYAIGLQVLDEEIRQSTDAALDVLKRRAEAMNIALVKTPDGYVLAPMHEGRVVKTEVFRSLPEALQRDVENKIGGLEDELKLLIAELPGREAEHGSRLSALNRSAAGRAILPQLSAVRALFAGSDDAVTALDAVEDLAVAEAAVSLSLKDRGSPIKGFDVAVYSINIAGSGGRAHVLSDVSPKALLGLAGRNVLGGQTVVPGALMHASGGFLIVEAWRLAADPKAWAILTAALEDGKVRPEFAGEVAGLADAIPIALTLIVAADDVSWKKLEAIDPGLASRFATFVRFESSAPSSDIGETSYAAFAETLARNVSALPLAEGGAKGLLECAIRRAGRSGHVSLDIGALGQILSEASAIAEEEGVKEIRVRDIERAAALREGTGAP